ncbi:MAG TPA: hypothetical protein DCY06_06020 [Bacteroidetes bacterium]|nr:hypothetical protein [Bacteroidota bacterium]HRI46623.1 hypothetical protein [Ignavibacteriaceae bacterium]
MLRESGKDSLYSRMGTTGPRIARLYPPIPRNTKRVKFDIYDYEKLFSDAETIKLIKEGRTIGCFYIESPGMRSLLWRLTADTFEMVVAASSIIRPGVAESGMMKEYILRHRDKTKRKYLFPEMEKVLGNTYGVMIYQEDVIKVANQIAGLSVIDADLLRRGMSGKVRSREVIERMQEKYFRSCDDNGLERDKAILLWNQMESFAGYAFCKAHSAAFAILSFQVAYLKAHYTAEFMASVLSNGGGYYSAAVYIQEAKRCGLTIVLPCINKSEYEYEGSNNTILIGLMAIKNMSRNTAENIVTEREYNGEYTSLLDFLLRTKTGMAESTYLIQCGAMDCFQKTRPTLLRLLHVYLKARKIYSPSYNDLFLNETIKLENEIETLVDYSIVEKCRLEYETFDYMVSKHPLELFAEELKKYKTINSSDMKNYHNKRISLRGWFMTSKRIKTSKGEIMKFLSLEDLTGTFEAVLFPRVYSKFAQQTYSFGPYIVTGRVDAESGNNLIVDKLEVLSRQGIKNSLHKDSADNKYYGDNEVTRDEDIMRIGELTPQKLIYAYVG